jgi:hypothetical protein
MFFKLIGIWSFDYKLNYDLVTTLKMSENPEKIATANWKQIRDMLMCISRTERLSEYTRSRAIKSGRIRLLLLRMKELAKQ